jgi:hypothetical protein
MNSAIVKHTKPICNHVTHVEDADYDEILSPNSLLFDVLKVSDSLVTIFNFHRFNYLYIDPHFHELLGTSFPATPGSQSNASFYELVHPDDLNNLSMSDRNGYERFHLLPHSEREHYSMTCQFRIRSVTGEYIYASIDGCSRLNMIKKIICGCSIAFLIYCRKYSITKRRKHG